MTFWTRPLKQLIRRVLATVAGVGFEFGALYRILHCRTLDRGDCQCENMWILSKFQALQRIGVSQAMIPLKGMTNGVV